MWSAAITNAVKAIFLLLTRYSRTCVWLSDNDSGPKDRNNQNQAHLHDAWVLELLQQPRVRHEHAGQVRDVHAHPLQPPHRILHVRGVQVCGQRHTLHMKWLTTHD
jgi:hypothetical protein